MVQNKINNIAMTQVDPKTSNDMEDDISLLDIIRFFIDNQRLIAMSTVACGVFGLAYGFLAPAQFEATMNVQMAMVNNTPIEAPNLVVEKMKLPLYFSPNTWAVCDTEQEMTPSRTLAKKLNPILNKNAPFIGLNYRADSPDEAKACLQAVLEDIRSKQKLLAEPVIKQKQTYLATLKDKLAAAEEVTKYLSSQNQSLQFKDEKFSAHALLLATRLNKDNEIKDLRNQIVDLEISLKPPQTQETYLAAPLYASAQRVAPNRSLILVLTLMAGFLLGIAGALTRKAWMSMKFQLKA